MVIKCILCGKEAKLYKNLCESCFRAKTKVLEIPKFFNIVRCAHCNSIRVGKKWVRFENLDDKLVGIIEKSISWNELCEEPKLNFKFEFKTESSIDAKILANSTILGLPFEEAESTRIELKKATCVTCSKKFGGYYEAQVQVRSEARKFTKEQIMESLRIAQNVIESSRDANAFLTRHEVLHEGLDLYLSTTALGRKIANELAKRYNGKIKISRSLVTRRAGKDIYRTTFSVRLSS